MALENEMTKGGWEMTRKRSRDRGLPIQVTHEQYIQAMMAKKACMPHRVAPMPPMPPMPPLQDSNVAIDLESDSDGFDLGIVVC